MMTIMMMMMMIMTDPFTTNLVVKGPVVKGSVVKGATSMMPMMMIMLLTSSCPSGGKLMFLTLSRMICRIVFRKAFRNSDVLEQNDEDEDNGHDFHDYQIICRETFGTHTTMIIVRIFTIIR